MENKIEEFLNYLQVERNCSAKTIHDYANDIEQFIVTMSISSIDQIDKHKIRGYLADLTNRGQQASTRNRKLTSVRSFCKYLCAEGYIDKNPAVDISYAKIEKRLPKTMATEVTNQIIDSAEGNPRDKAALETLYGTGCRVEELVNIKIEDIDMQQARIRIFGKGSKERVIPISIPAVIAIVDYIGKRKVESEYLFPSPVNPNKPITTRSMYDIIIKYGRVNNVHANPHKFRHSIATDLLAAGLDIREIQELLGHSNINTTTIYTQVAIDHMAKQFHSLHPRG